MPNRVWHNRVRQITSTKLNSLAVFQTTVLVDFEMVDLFAALVTEQKIFVFPIPNIVASIGKSK